MIDLKASRTAIVTDLTRTRHMFAVSAVILGSIFMPLVGGPIRAYEIAEIQDFLSGEHAAVSEAAAAEVPSMPAQRAARTPAAENLETAALTDESAAELTTFELPAQTEPDLLGEDDGVALEDDTKTLDEPALDELDTEILEEESVQPNA